MRRRAVLRAGATALGLGVVGAAGSTAADRAGYAPLGELPLPGATEAVADGQVAYVAVSNGYATVDLSDPSAPGLLAERRNLLADREGGPLRRVQDLSVEGDRLLVVAPASPIRGALSGALLVDVSDPAAPRQIAFRETDFPIHNCVLRDGTAYLTGNRLEGNPLVALDAADGLAPLGRWSILDHDPAWDDVPTGLRSLHDLHVQDGMAYLAYWDAGTWLVDVSDPAAPTYVSWVGERDAAALAGLEGAALRRESTVPPGNAHYVDVDADAGLLAVGRETWALEGEDGLVGGPSGVDLYDVSDPTAPARLATIPPPPTPEPTRAGIWTTAHNFELTDERLYTAWYQGGVKRHDLRDPTDPREEAWWRRPDEARFWTAQAAVVDEFFVASNMGVDGADPSLYTFPDRPGEQASPPTPSLTRAPGTPATPTRTPTPTSTPTATPTPSPTPAAPGFGPMATLAALGIAAWRRFRE